VKSNKSFLKRLKITRTGKVLRRAGGQNHFNAKAPRSNQLNRKRLIPFSEAKAANKRYQLTA